MALTYGFYNSVKGDRKYDAMQFSEIIDTLIIDGIIPSKGQLFAVTTAGNGMQINVGTGMAWFFHSWTKNDSVMVLTVEESDITRPRIDAVVLEVNREDNVRANSIKIVKGEPNVNAEKPTLVTTAKVHQYPLAWITVPAAAEEIKAENIENAVGLTPTVFATGILDTAPLDELWNQWEGEWDTWFAAIKLQLSGDVVANLQGQIEEKVDKADKATSADATAGTSDEKWMTPALTKQMIGENEGIMIDGKKYVGYVYPNEEDSFITSFISYKEPNVSSFSRAVFELIYNEFTLFVWHGYLMEVGKNGVKLYSQISKVIDMIKDPSDPTYIYILVGTSSSSSTNLILYKAQPILGNALNNISSIMTISESECSKVTFFPAVDNSPYYAIMVRTSSPVSVLVYIKSMTDNAIRKYTVTGLAESIPQGFISGSRIYCFSLEPKASGNYTLVVYKTLINCLDGTFSTDTSHTIGNNLYGGEKTAAEFRLVWFQDNIPRLYIPWKSGTYGDSSTFRSKVFLLDPYTLNTSAFYTFSNADSASYGASIQMYKLSSQLMQIYIGTTPVLFEYDRSFSEGLVDVSPSSYINTLYRNNYVITGTQNTEREYYLVSRDTGAYAFLNTSLCKEVLLNKGNYLAFSTAIKYDPNSSSSSNRRKLVVQVYGIKKVQYKEEGT